MPRWKGLEYPEYIPDKIYREVLNDIFKESFKREFLLADSAFYELKPVGFDNAMQGVAEVGEVQNFDADLDASTREDHNVKIMAWIPGLMDGGETGFESSDLSTRRRSAYALCFHYIASYADYFQRAPIIPHTLMGPISILPSARP